MVAVMVESIALILGTLAAALAVCGLLWWAFRCLGHPHWGALVTLLLMPLPFVVRGSTFLDMTVVFALLFAIPFWAEGRKWRSPGA